MNNENITEDTNNYYTGKPSLSPVPLHVASAIIRPYNKQQIKTVALETVEKQANQQIAMLKRQADLIMLQVKEIEERVKVSAEIYMADINFVPVIGNTYHLYEKNENRILSLVGPQEWGR